MESQHRKELKALEGEKRAAIKKAKGMKGKKAKEALAALEEEYANKLTELQAKHQAELAAAAPEGGDAPAAADSKDEEEPSISPEEQEAERKRLAKQAKARAKREKQRQVQLELEQEQERDLNDPTSARKQELAILEEKLKPLQFQIAPVASDGHCLYRAVASQLGKGGDSYTEIRNLCATSLETHEADFSPFCEFSETITTYPEYVERVRNSADWGGHVELRALSLALKRTIIVYSVQHAEPLILGEEYEGEEPIRLSYHLHYYTLGEHYNEVVKADPEETEE